MLIFEIFVSLWLNECDGCMTLPDPNFVTIIILFFGVYANENIANSFGTLYWFR